MRACVHTYIVRKASETGMLLEPATDASIRNTKVQEGPMCSQYSYTDERRRLLCLSVGGAEDKSASCTHLSVFFSSAFYFNYKYLNILVQTHIAYQ